MRAVARKSVAWKKRRNLGQRCAGALTKKGKKKGLHGLPLSAWKKGNARSHRLEEGAIATSLLLLSEYEFSREFNRIGLETKEHLGYFKGFFPTRFPLKPIKTRTGSSPQHKATS